MAKAGWTKNQTQKDAIEEQVSASIPKEIARPTSRSFDAKSESTDKPVRKKNRLDPLTEKLGCKGYTQNAHFAWLEYRVDTIRYALTVDRYYQELKLAVDLNNKDKSLLELKKALCEKNGINYFHCENSEEITAMIDQIPYLLEKQSMGEH